MTLAETIESVEKLQASLEADGPALFYVSDADRLTKLRKALPALLSAARRVVALEAVGGWIGDLRNKLAEANGADFELSPSALDKLLDAAADSHAATREVIEMAGLLRQAEARARELEALVADAVREMRGLREQQAMPDTEGDGRQDDVLRRFAGLSVLATANVRPPVQAPIRHTWVPIAECWELTDGEYETLVKGERRMNIWQGGRFKTGFTVTHVLSPHLGPIPGAP